MCKKLFLIFIFSLNLNAQNLKLIKSIGQFTDACSFSYISSGYFFVSDIQTNEIYKLDTLGTILKEIGGYGWQSGQFDSPVDVFSNELNNYICDKNNDRIVITDRELNFLSVFQTSENNSPDFIFKQPTCFGINNQSDFFILDSYNQRILKYNLRGNFIQQIGGYDAGNYYLTNPSKFALSPDGKLFVINDNTIFVFDQFGLGLIKIASPIKKAKIKIFNSYITISNEKDIYTLNLADINSGFINNKITDDILIEEAIFNGNSIFVLTKSSILQYE